MILPLFKPLSAILEPEALPVILPQINEASDVGFERGVGSALFTGSDVKRAAHCFFEQKGGFKTDLRLRFAAESNRVFFLRAEHYSEADISLAVEAEQQSETLLVLHTKARPDSRTRLEITASLEKESRLTLLVINLNEGVSTSDISVEMNGSGARAQVFFVEVGKNGSRSETRIENICAAIRTEGLIETYSMMLNDSFSRIQSAPVITADAFDADNRLEQKSFLFSPNARVDLLPLLSVANNRVHATHRAEVARLSPEDLFYFASRGVGPQVAEHLLLDGFLEKMLSEIPEPGIRKCIGQNTHHFLECGA